MEKCPAEILNYIFIKLSFEDRIKCTLVCHFWYNTLDQCSLLYDLYIRTSEYLRFKDMLERLPHRAAQVEKLKLSYYFDPDFDKRTLCNLLPNLREIELMQLYDGNSQQDYSSRTFQFTHSTSKLEKVKDAGGCELAHQIVISNRCSRLKSLELDFSDPPDSMNNELIRQLMNLAILEELKLNNIEINILDFEIMHNNLPSIKELEIRNGKIIPCQMPAHVKPATLITALSLEIDIAEDPRAHAQWYFYMSKKYPNINSFDYIDCPIRDGDFDYVKSIFEKGIFLFIQVIGSRINRFSFDNFCGQMEVFNKFSKFGCKLKELLIKSYESNIFFLEEMVQSNQCKYIQKLTLEGIVPEPIDRLQNMTALEYLDIDYYDSVMYDEQDTTPLIDFSKLVESCPHTLTMLSITLVDIKLNPSTSNLTFIRTLKLAHVELTKRLAKIISTCFPKLIELYLKGDMTSDLIISLPNHNLIDVDITTFYIESSNGFSIKTTDDDKTRYHAPRPVDYCSLNGQMYTRETIILVSKEEFDEPLVLSFTCASVEKYDFDSYQK